MTEEVPSAELTLEVENALAFLDDLLVHLPAMLRDHGKHDSGFRKRS